MLPSLTIVMGMGVDGARVAGRANRTTRTLAVAALAMTLLSGMGTVPAPGASAARRSRPAAESECSGGWRSMAVPASVFISTPFEVVTRGGRPEWLVGGSTSGLVILDWRDGAWTDPGVRTGGFRGLTSGLAPRAGRLVGAGYRRPASGGLRASAGRSLGARWSEEDVPRAGGPATITGLAFGGPASAWAVGTRLRHGRPAATVLRRRDGRWRQMPAPASASPASLTAVTRAPSGAVWVVGTRQPSGARWRPLIARIAASGWQAHAASGVPNGDAVLAGVSFRSARKGWAVGHLRPAGSSRYEPLLLRWDGRRWHREALDLGTGENAVLSGVAAGAEGLWVSGTFLADGDRETRGFVATRAGGGWEVRELAVPPTVRSEMLSVAAVGSGAMATGTVGSTSVVIETCDLVPAVTRGRIRVGDMQARRRTPTVEDEEAPPRHDRDRAAADLPTPGRPVRPSGFRVRDVASASGLETTATTHGGLATDLDGDGWTDIFYSRHGRLLPRLYLGGPGGFVLTEGGAFSIVDRHGCDSADVDADGRQDILCAVGRSRGTAIHRHELTLDPAGPGARLARGSLGANDPFGRGVAVAFIRLDDDPYPELLVTTSPDRVDGIPGPNRFFRNADGRFEAAPELGLDRHIGGSCTLASDIDGDGDEDLLMCAAKPDDGSRAGLRILRNEGGRLRDRTRGLGIAPIGDVAALVADLTGDGRPDLVQLAKGRLRVSRGTASGFVRRYEVRVADAAGVAAGDVDGDGALDLYVATGGARGNDRDLLLVNRGGAQAFTSVRIPQAADGKGETVLALDHDQNGLTDFLVLNGHDGPGPVQLLASYPAP